MRKIDSSQCRVYGGLVFLVGLFIVTFGEYYLAVIYLEALFPDVNKWIWVFILTGFMTWINVHGSKVVAYFNSWIMFIQLLIIGVFTLSLVYSKLMAGTNADDGTINAASLPIMEPKAVWVILPTWRHLLVVQPFYVSLHRLWIH